MCEPQVVFLSLRTHKPILPGAIHRDHAGEMLSISTLAVPDDPLIATWPRKSQTFCCISARQIEMLQFTNRRMRTFIATPSARNVNSTEDPP
jgi:hypothetical protein